MKMPSAATPAPRIVPLLATAVLLAAAPASAQTPPPAAPAGPKNLIRNGGFEQKRDAVNLIDGVNDRNQLQVDRLAIPALTESGAVAPRNMPPDVDIADMNGDGRPDLLVTSPLGYYFLYLNSGDAKTPKFTFAEILPVFISFPFAYSSVKGKYFVRQCPRVALADFDGNRALDLIIGDLYGEIFQIKNIGSITKPTYRQPATLDSVEVPTSSVVSPDKSVRHWGNLLDPVVADLQGNGKQSLIVGEGSFSANSVFIFENQGSGGAVKFGEDPATARRRVLMAGEGREVLSPAIADYNGDGRPDLLVADRLGQVSVHLNLPGAKPGEPLPFSSFISFGAKDKLGQPITISAGDLNGDGLFDLAFGRASGEVQFSLNTGTKEQPKFADPQDFMGEDKWVKNISTAPSWTFDKSDAWGNIMGYFAVVSAAEEPGFSAPEPADKPPAERKALKAGVFPSLNTVVPFPSSAFSGQPLTFLVETQVNAKVGQKYKLSFQSRGAKVTDATYLITADARGVVQGKAEHGERGEVINGDKDLREIFNDPGKFSAGPAWSSQGKDTVIKFNGKEFESIKTISATIRFNFTLSDPTSALYLDDIQMIETN